VRDHSIEKYSYQPIDRVSRDVFITVCRCPGGVVGFQDKASELFNHFQGPIFIMHKEMRSNMTSSGHVFVNYSLDVIFDVLNVRVNDANKHRLATAVAPNARAPAVMPRRLFVDQDNVDEMRLAIRASEEEHARFLAKQKPPIQNWSQLVKPVEPVQHGMPACAVCFDNKATMCIIKCGHQSLCDECIQQLVHLNCVVCRIEFDLNGVVRPLWPMVCASTPGPVRNQKAKKRKTCKQVE
jgi:hypothetical protein